MTTCGNCKRKFGDDLDKITRVQVSETGLLAPGVRFWLGHCDECGGWTEPCLTMEEAKARIGIGLYSFYEAVD